jgi:hypothetical protein
MSKTTEQATIENAQSNEDQIDFLAMLEEDEASQESMNPCSMELSFNAKKAFFSTYNYMEESEDAKGKEDRKVIPLLYLTKVLEVFNLKRNSEGKFSKLTSTPFRNYDDYPVTVSLDGKRIGGGGCYDDVRDMVKAHGGGVSHVYYCLDLGTNKLIQFRAEGAPKGNSRKAAFLKAARSGISNLDPSLKEVQPTKGFTKSPAFELHVTDTLIESDLADFYLMGVKMTPMSKVTREQLQLAGTFLKMVTDYIDSFKVAPVALVETLPVEAPELEQEEPDFEFEADMFETDEAPEI